MTMWKYDDMKIRWYYTAAPSQFVSPQILFVWCFPISTPFCARNLNFWPDVWPSNFITLWWKNYPETISQEKICIRSYDTYLSYVYMQNRGIQQKLNFKGCAGIFCCCGFGCQELPRPLEFVQRSLVERATYGLVIMA